MLKLIQKNKLFVLIFLIFILIISTVFLLINYETNQLPNKIIALENKGYVIKNNLQHISYSDNFNFEKYNQKFNSDYKFVITDSNLLKPVVTLIEKSKNSSLYTSIYKLERNFTNVEVYEKIQVNIQNKSFQEAIELAKKYDLSKENPDPENIIVQTPPTKEEVQKQKDKDKLITDQQNNKEYIEELNKCSKIREDEITKYLKIDPTTNQIYISPETNYPTLDYNNYPEQIGSIMNERSDCEKQVNIKFDYPNN
jgi:hypothetical protein